MIVIVSAAKVFDVSLIVPLRSFLKIALLAKMALTFKMDDE